MCARQAHSTPEPHLQAESLTSQIMKGKSARRGNCHRDGRWSQRAATVDSRTEGQAISVGRMLPGSLGGAERGQAGAHMGVSVSGS